MKSNEIIKQIGSFSICFLVILLVLFSTIFFILEIYRYLFWPQITGLESELKETVGIVSIGNETLLSLLAIVLAFAAALSWSFYKIIERDIKKKSEEDWRKERNLSRVELKLSLGLFHMRLYRTLYNGRTRSNDPDTKAKNEIDFALAHIGKALEYLGEMQEKECLHYLFLAKNNRAYYLARKWNYDREDKSDVVFKEYLENTNRAREYSGDKRIAKGYIDYLKKKKAPELRPDLSKNFEDTFVWVEKIFSVDVDIKLDE